MFFFDDSEICRGILESLPTGLCVIDTGKRIVFWSDGAARITGYLRHEVIGHSCVAEPLLHCDQPGCEFCAEDCPLAVAMKTSHAAQANGVLHHKAGHEIPVLIRAVPVHNRHGSVVGAAEIFDEVQHAANSNGRELCRQLPDCIDPVTGVASRTMIQAHLRQALATFEEAQIPFGLLLLQAERLAHFRASLGPEAASSLLRVVARSLESTLWITDFVGRWADDQFLVVLNGCREEALHAVREQVRRTVSREGIEWWGERRFLPISLGEACAQLGDTLEAVMERVKRSLDSASKQHRTASAGERSPGS